MHLQVPEAVSETVSEMETMYSLVVVVEHLKWAVASLAVVWAVVELLEPKVADFGLDFAAGPKIAEHAPTVAEPIVVGAEPVQVLVPMDSNWLEAVFGVALPGSMVAELEVEVVMGPMHSLKAVVVVVVEAEPTPKVVEVDRVLGHEAMSAAGLDAVLAEPTVVVAGALVEPAESKEVVLQVFSEVAASTGVAVESLFVIAASMDFVVAEALVLGVDPRGAVFVVSVPAHLVVPKMAEPVAEAVVVLEAGPRTAEFGGSRYL